MVTDFSYVHNFQANKARNVIKASGARIGGTVVPIEASGMKIGPLRQGLGALEPISGIPRPKLVALGLRLGLLGQDRRLWGKDLGLRGQ